MKRLLPYTVGDLTKPSPGNRVASIQQRLTLNREGVCVGSAKPITTFHEVTRGRGVHLGDISWPRCQSAVDTTSEEGSTPKYGSIGATDRALWTMLASLWGAKVGFFCARLGQVWGINECSLEKFRMKRQRL